MTFDQGMEEVLATFIVESFELLQNMEADLLALETIDAPEETIHAIFRAAHTIKGSAGIFSFDHIVQFTHVLESVLDRLRSGKQTLSPRLIDALLPCCDHLNSLIRDVADGNYAENLSLTAYGQQLLTALQPYLSSSESTTDAVATPQIEPILAQTHVWHLCLQLNENSLRDGMDSLSLIHYLTSLGEITDIKTFLHALPDADNMDPESNYLGFDITLHSDADQQTLVSVFEFVCDDSQIHILPLENKADYYRELLYSCKENQAQLGEWLLKTELIGQTTFDEVLNAQNTLSQALTSADGLLDRLPVAQLIEQTASTSALEKNQPATDNKVRENQTIRVDAERLDKLIDMVGELVISAAAANLRAKQTGDLAMLEANAAVINLVEATRDSALQLRMVPIGSIFSRFQRVVHDVSRELGKEINLRIFGAETEVDKSVVEKIGDPLLHLVRNAIDHGIESPQSRIEQGKPAQGVLQLNAYHSSGSIVIEVSDDGAGLNREKILIKAIERGLIKANAIPTDQAIYACIFEPGFSTASEISNLSGRGVGMDVVKRNITELRGEISIESNAGKGTTLRIYLPLTLAIIDGFLVSVGHSSFVVPMDSVVECVELPCDDDHDYMELRGEVLPFIRLGQVFGKHTEAVRRQNVIVVQHLHLKAGLVVDKLLGEFQTVIKPLGKLFSHAQGIGGSTILGSGEVALIIDVPTLLRQQERMLLAEQNFSSIKLSD